MLLWKRLASDVYHDTYDERLECYILYTIG